MTDPNWCSLLPLQSLHDISEEKDRNKRENEKVRSQKFHQS
jgi:hypothetical protein